jgi:uncharacterized protein YqeY
MRVNLVGLGDNLAWEHTVVGRGGTMDKLTLDAEIKQAMRDKDKSRLSILRMVKNEIDTKEKESGEEVSDADVVAVVKKVMKQTGETLDGSLKAGTDAERTALLEEQVAILEGYLPQQVSGDELEAIIDRVMAEGSYTEKRDMGKVIGAVVEETGGNVDKAEVAKIVGGRLS